MRLEVVTDTRGLAGLRAPWTTLAVDGRTTPLLRGHTWAMEWWRALGGGRELRVVVAADRGEVLGILPLFLENSEGYARLALVGSTGGGADYLSVLARSELVRAELIRHALNLGADVLELGDLESGDPAVGAFASETARLGTPTELLARYPCPYIAVREPFDRFLAGMARRENLRRRAKWLAAQPGFEVTCARDAREVPGFIELFLRLHHARWRDDGGSQAFHDGRLVAFQRAVCARLADEGRLGLWTMRVAGAPVAVAYGFDDDEGRTLYYQSGFAPEWGSKSVGLVLLARFVEDAFGRGRREIDFLRGAEPYKAEWTKDERRTVTARAALTSRGRAVLGWKALSADVRERMREAIPRALRVPITRFVRDVRRRRSA